MGLYDNLTYESDEIFGFSQSTLLILGVIFVISFFLRMIVSNVSHSFFGVIVRNDTIRQKTVKKGDKALGSVAGYAFAFVTARSTELVDAPSGSYHRQSWGQMCTVV